jgi:hypothetical protein
MTSHPSHPSPGIQILTTTRTTGDIEVHEEYLQNLKRAASERQAATSALRAAKGRPLHERIAEYFQGQQSDSLTRSWTMAELTALFRAPAQRIGPALHTLGWKRKRSWRAGSPYGRFWEPPC